MTRSRQCSGTLLGLSIIITAFVLSPSAWAHGIVGERMFIEPLFAEDANIKNEWDLPLAEFLTMPDGTYRTLGTSLEKALWPDRWSVVVEQSRVYRRSSSGAVAGFDDLEIGTKVAAYRSERHEFVFTPALFITAPTGSAKVAENRTALRPMLVFAKGLGDLKPGWLRPGAIQGDIGYEATATGERERQLIYDVLVEYSLPYLNQFIRHANAGYELEHNLRLGHSVRAILGDLYPFVEFNGSTPVQGTPGATTSFVRPGAAYMGKYFQLSLAPDIPLRGGTSQHRVGAVLLLDLFLDEISPKLGWTPFHKQKAKHDPD